MPKGTLASIGAVAEAQTIPREFLAKILKDLTSAGILVSFQGVAGGYKLARPAKDISFLDVIEAMDGPITINLCVQGDDCCDHYKSCKMRDFWIREQEHFKKALSRANFAKYKADLKKK
jgi:Rrf2 family protein